MGQAQDRQWVGAIYAEDVEMVGEMLAADPTLASSRWTEFDDPFRERRFPVSTLLFAAAGPPQQTVGPEAVKRRINLALVRTLVEHGADPNGDSAHGRPLSWVRDRAVAEYLISKGGDVNLEHDNGGRPLNFTCWKSDPPRLRMLLELGADPNLPSARSGETFLHTLALYTHPAHGVNARNLPRLKECLRQLLAAGANPNARTLSGIRSDASHCPQLKGETPLHFAAQFGDAEFLQAFLEHGADPGLANAEGRTPLDFAQAAGRGDAILALLAGG